MAITLGSQQWEDVLRGRLEEEEEDRESMDVDPPHEAVKQDNDIYYTPPVKHAPTPPDTQVREQRSAFLIVRCLQTEGIL